MRYYTKELWKRINDLDEKIRIKAEEEWYSNDLAYNQRFKDVRKKLSRKFVEKYLSRKGFHDYIIQNIAIKKTKRSYSCELELTLGTDVVIVKMSGIHALKIDISTFSYCIQGNLTWGFGEFDITSENKIKLELLCDLDNEMIFEFEKINIGKRMPTLNKIANIKK